MTDKPKEYFHITVDGEPYCNTNDKVERPIACESYDRPKAEKYRAQLAEQLPGKRVEIVEAKCPQPGVVDDFEYDMTDNFSVPSRKLISTTHPVFGEGYRALDDADTLQSGDQTACVSRLLSFRGDQWVTVDETWKNDLGKTVGQILGPGSPDADAGERVFRRKAT